MQESAEEVLARLEQYVATLRGRSPVSVATATAWPVQAPPTRVSPEQAAPAPAIAVDTLIPTRVPTRVAAPPEPARGTPRLLHEVAPALLAVASCVVVLLAFVLFSGDVAVVVAAALGLVGAVGVARRVPLAKAWIFGLVVAVLLVRFS